MSDDLRLSLADRLRGDIVEAYRQTCKLCSHRDFECGQCRTFRLLRMPRILKALEPVIDVMEAAEQVRRAPYPRLDHSPNCLFWYSACDCDMQFVSAAHSWLVETVVALDREEEVDGAR